MIIGLIVLYIMADVFAMVWLGAMTPLGLFFVVISELIEQWNNRK